MDLQNALNFVPTFVLAFFRLAGLMIASPLFGSAKVPRVVKVMFASVATLGMISAVRQPIRFPDSLAQLTLGIGSELIFGLAMGTIVSFTFIAAQWAGEMIGQQMGFNLSEVFDPQYGGGGTLVGDLYFMLTLVIFLAINGHHLLLAAVHDSFTTVPLMGMVFDRNVFGVVLDMLMAATLLAMRLAAPMFFTMLVVDLAMGVISKAMPAFNIMSAGMSIRSAIGILILLIGLGLTTDVLGDSLGRSIEHALALWHTGGR